MARIHAHSQVDRRVADLMARFSNFARRSQPMQRSRIRVEVQFPGLRRGAGCILCKIELCKCAGRQRRSAPLQNCASIHAYCLLRRAARSSISNRPQENAVWPDHEFFLRWPLRSHIENVRHHSRTWLQLAHEFRPKPLIDALK